MAYTKIKFILRTTQNLSCVLSVKSKVEISQNLCGLLRIYAVMLEGEKLWGGQW